MYSLRFLSTIVFIFLVSEIKCQKVESIYVSKIKTNFENLYKNYSEIDSLILYENQTFRKRYLCYGFDEISELAYLGNWNKDGEKLELKLKERIDSSKTKTFKPFSITYKVRARFLIPNEKNDKKLKKVK